MLSSREKSNLTRWNGRQSPFYEAYFLKWSDPSQSAAAWIRYTLLACDQRPPEASVWAMFFDAKDPAKNAALKKTFPIKDVRIERDLFYLGAGASAIFDDGCRGHLDDGHQAASWELKFQEKGEPLWYFPSLLYKTAFPKTKFVLPYLSSRISGEFSFGDRRLTLTGVPANQGHLWGVEHAESWVWANANTFTEDPSFCFDGLSARVRLGNRLSPALTALFFQWEGRIYRFHTPLHWITNRSTHELDRWHFEAEGDGLLFVGDYHTTPDRMIGVRYQDPTDGERFCHHSETASVTIRIFKRSKSGWQAVKTLTATDSAALEVVGRKHDPRVRLLLS
jgi:tocopherol cyclase-like protein